MDDMVTHIILFTLLLVTVSAADRQGDDVQRRLGLLEQRYASDMARLETTNQQLISDMARLETTNQQLISDMARLETTNQQLTIENDAIKARLDSLETQFKQCKDETYDRKDDDSETVGAKEDAEHVMSSKAKRNVAPLAKHRTAVPNDVMKEPQYGQKRALVEGMNVAFTAYLDHDLNKQGPNQILIFNKVLLNHGNAYNNFSGMFTAPMPGVYSFTFFIGERDVNQYFVSLTVNSHHMLDAVSESAHAAQDIQGGNTANLLLSQGDVVSVRHLSNVGTHLEGSKRITTFSGFLIYPVEDSSTIVGK